MTVMPPSGTRIVSIAGTAVAEASTPLLPFVTPRHRNDAPADARPVAALDVECERDIVDAVCAARERGWTVRPAGARGSKNDCYRTDGLSLEFGRYDRVVAFDGRTVTVEAGMKVGRLNEFLRHRGAIVPTCGEWQGATVGGSLATGSHGGSSKHGIHSTFLVGLRIITADGTPLDIDRRSPYFDHAAVSLGALGVISTATLAYVPAFHLALDTRVLTFDEYLRDHAALNAAAVWFPAARRVLTFTANRVAPRAPTEPRMERFCVKTFLMDAASRYFNVNAVSHRRLERHWVDHGDLILCPIPDRTARVQVLRTISRDWKAMEAAVPVPLAPVALERLARLLYDHRRSMLNAVGLRTSASDAFPLSPCFGQDAFSIDLFFSDTDAAFTRALGGTIESLRGRCHWGKHIGLDEGYLGDQYPGFAGFREARAELDPDQVFSSKFTRRMTL
jgi:FAD/FMN-containing dehydrogenase